MAFPPLENSDHVAVIDFPINSKQDTLFNHMTFDYSHGDWDGLHDHFHGKISLNSASAAASEFCEWVQVGIGVYIPHCKYQVKPLISMVFSRLCCCHSS